MSWATYPVNEEVLVYTAPTDTILVEPKRAASARLLVENVARRHVGSLFSVHGGERGFYDACASAPELASSLDALLVYAYLHLFYADGANWARGGSGHGASEALRYYDDGGGNGGRESGLLYTAVLGFAQVAGSALVRADPSTSPASRHAATGSAPPRTFDCETLKGFV